MKSKSLFLLFFLSTIITIAPIAVQAHSEISEIPNWTPELRTTPSGRSLLSIHNTDNPEQDINLVVWRDGTAFLVDQKSSTNTLWSLRTGSSLSSLHQTVRDDQDGDGGDTEENTYVMDLDDKYSVDKDNVIVETTDRGVMNLMEILEDLYNNGIPYISKDKVFVAQKKSTVFIIDFDTGRLVNVLGTNGANNALPEAKSEDPENARSLYVIRTDYGLLHAPRDLNRDSWKFEFSRLEAYFLEKEREHRIPVVHLRDGSHIKFLLEISRLNHTAAKPFLPHGSTKHSTPLVGVGNTGQRFPRPLAGKTNSAPPVGAGNSGQSFPRPLAEKTDSKPLLGAENIGQSFPRPLAGKTNQNVDFLVSAEHRSHTNSNQKTVPLNTKLQYNPYFWVVLVLVILSIASIKMRRKKSTTELIGSSGKNITGTKRKKSRKSLHSKIRVDDNSIAENTPYDNAEKLNGTSSVERNGTKPWSRLEIPVNDVANGRRIGKLFVSNTEIAKGSNGTIVMEGIYDGRPVAVKRLVQAHHDIANKEIENLIASDTHQNIVRWYGVEYDSDFIYLSLERCTCSLGDLIKMSSDSPHQSVSTQVNSNNPAKDNLLFDKAKGLNKHVELWKANGYPAPQLLNLMRDMVSGLVHLHELGIIHRDLKPQNILIINEKTLCAKLSDMGISKRLLEDKSSLGHHPTGYGSSGWQAPEQLLHGRQTRAVDLFGLGCVLFFCITGGKHPYGDHLERDINIVKNKVDLFMVEHIPEAVDLLSLLLNPTAELRPTASYVLQHPLFWSSEKRLSFLRDSSDRVELEDRETKSCLLEALENVAPVALGGKWDEKMEAKFIDNIGRYRRYKFDSTRDLLRVMRNKLNHYRELPKEIQDILGGVPEGFDDYFSSRFPKFLIEVYKVMYRHCMEEECFWKYFRTV